jgi:CheY-like chemotaxis protein
VLPKKRQPDKPAAGTILVAEDERGVRLLVKVILEQLGYTILEATDGCDALRVIEQSVSEIHLLLTDIDMPLMNGYELAMQVRSILPGTRILYMSGHAAEELAYFGIAPTDIGFIQKPFTPSQLAQKVRMALAGESGFGRYRRAGG